MAGEGVDPGLIEEFLAESGELIEQLDADLVSLEGVASGGPESQELLNGIFRALHTIKGAASFLAMTPLTNFAHAAEDALNCLRKGDVSVTTDIMDAMLRSVDVLRGMLGEVTDGRPLSEGPRDLVDALHLIASGEKQGDAGRDGGNTDGDTTAQAQTSAWGATAAPLGLAPEKVDLLEFMVADLKESAKKIGEHLSKAAADDSTSEVVDDVVELAAAEKKTAEFLGIDTLSRLIDLLLESAPSVPELPKVTRREVLVRLRAVAWLIDRQADALGQQLSLSWPLDTLAERLEALVAGGALDPDLVGAHNDNAAAVLALDGVVDKAAFAGSGEAAAVASAPTPADPQPGAAQPGDREPSNAAAKAGGADAPGRGSTGGTIRVDVERLENLLNLVGQLVLNKNRLLAMARQMREYQLPHEVEEDLAGATGDLDRVTGELQTGVMSARMQPLAKLFDRYPRVIRDIARITGKKISLEIEGKETEVDKTVLEILADPLVHILRNSADHGIESPQQRAAAGKPETGTIRLSAEHQGGHVRVAIVDNGKGLDREVIGAKAVERGLTTTEQLASLPDEEVFRFIFAAGFSTAAKVTDLSGRGVGMDVVRTNIAQINGVVNVSSVTGQGTTIEVVIPLTVAIMPAMMVGIGQNLYAIPLTSITEIVRPEEREVHTVKGQPVIRLRDSVLPLLDLRRQLQEHGSQEAGRFAVVVCVGQQRAGLLVDRLIGQQEVVIKPLDDQYTSDGPFSGATIRENGHVSLILDVIKLIRQAQAHERAAA